jgi:hypothetical protein
MDGGFGVAGVSRRWCAALVVGLVCGTVLFGANAVPARAATTAVDCSSDSGALATALSTASNGDTLSIVGTCDGTYEIGQSVTLQGSGGATLDGQSAGSVMTIDAGATVAVNGLTITNGSTDGAGGGGIFNDGGTLSVSQSVFESDNAFSGRGGAILNLGGTLTVQGSTFGPSSNESGDVDTGDAIANQGGIATITTSTFDAPAQTVIRNADSGSLTIMTSTISQGLIAVRNVSGTLLLENSTVSGNGAIDAHAAAVENFDTATIVASTISNNLEWGIEDLGTLTISNSIVSNNTVACVAAAFGGVLTDGGYNIADDALGFCGFSTDNHSIPNADPLLDPAGLAPNGGPTQTIALQSGSPAIDAIPQGMNGCGTSIATDQRGVTRPEGSGCDIGAFEVEPQSPAQLLAALGEAVIGVGPGTSLADKIAQATTYLNKNDIPDTCSTLTAFINQAKARSGKTIPAPETATLIADAKQIKTLLGC